MKSQILHDTKSFPCRGLIFFYLLLLVPYVLSARTMHFTKHVFEQHHALDLAFCTVLQDYDPFVKDTLENPGLPATSSDYVGATYPGGARAWLMHLNKTFRYPPEAIAKNIQGTVKVKFLIDAKGRVKKPEAIGGPQELRKEAVRVIKQSGRWIPATTNGVSVQSYKEQTITFRTEGD